MQRQSRDRDGPRRKLIVVRKLTREQSRPDVEQKSGICTTMVYPCDLGSLISALADKTAGLYDRWEIRQFTPDWQVEGWAVAYGQLSALHRPRGRMFVVFESELVFLPLVWESDNGRITRRIQTRVTTKALLRNPKNSINPLMILFTIST
jgi:hypothetical protein